MIAERKKIGAPYPMPNQKLENLLNLALEATPEERASSQELETGFKMCIRDRSWIPKERRLSFRRR